MADRPALIHRITDAAAIAAAASAGFQSNSSDGTLDSSVRSAHVFLSSDLPHHLLQFDPHNIPANLVYFNELQSFSPSIPFREKSMLEEACEQQQHQNSNQPAPPPPTATVAVQPQRHHVISMDYQLQPITSCSIVCANSMNAEAMSSYHYYLQGQQQQQQSTAQSVREHEGHESPLPNRSDTLGIPFDTNTLDTISTGPAEMHSTQFAHSGLIELDQSPAGLMGTEFTEHLDSSSLGAGSVCLICGDRATGKHYGAYSCDGCKGFFRRSVRRNHSYTCRHKRICVVTKDKRNQCRFCRLRKCFRVGMKKSAVQNERDKISNRPLAFDAITSGQSLLDLQQLLQAESRAHAMIQKNYTPPSSSKQHNESGSVDDDLSSDGNQRFADVSDICDSIKTQLMFLIEWAKNLPSFGNLAMSDQIALLQSHAGEMLILGAVWRSLSCSGSNHRNQSLSAYVGRVVESSITPKSNRKSSNTQPRWSVPENDLQPPQSGSSHTSDSSPPPPPIAPSQSNTTVGCAVESTVEVKLPQDYLVGEHQPHLILLGNSRVISKQSPQSEIAEIANRILDQLYQPMQELCLEDSEVACLRAIIFFDPNCTNLTEHGRQLVRACQYQIQTELMHLMNDKLYLPQGRFGALLLLLPDLRSITSRMIDRLQIAQQMGLTRLDGLLSEILLRDSDVSDRKIIQTDDSVAPNSESERTTNMTSTFNDVGIPRKPDPSSPYTAPQSSVDYSQTFRSDTEDGSGLARLSELNFPRHMGQRLLQPVTSSTVADAGVTVQNQTRSSLMSNSTAFVPYLQRHATNVQLGETENYVSSQTRPGWNEFGFGRQNVFDYYQHHHQHQHRHPTHADLAVYQARRLSASEIEARQSFLMHMPPDSIDNPLTSVCFDAQPSSSLAGPNPLEVSSGYETHYYSTNLHDPSTHPETGRDGFVLVSSCSGSSAVDTMPNPTQFSSRAELVPRLSMMGNVFSSMFAGESRIDEVEDDHDGALYSSYYNTHP